VNPDVQRHHSVLFCDVWCFNTIFLSRLSGVVLGCTRDTCRCVRPEWCASTLLPGTTFTDRSPPQKSGERSSLRSPCQREPHARTRSSRPGSSSDNHTRPLELVTSTRDRSGDHLPQEHSSSHTCRACFNGGQGHTRWQRGCRRRAQVCQQRVRQARAEPMWRLYSYGREILFC
jgi:hypothetical protein